MRIFLFTMLMTICIAAAEENVNGIVTFLASGSVYLSIGRDKGIIDSTIVYVLRQRDTISVLKVFAVSSKSSVCRIQENRKEIRIGDPVVAIVKPGVGSQLAVQKFDSTVEIQIDNSPHKIIRHREETANKKLNIRGRVGLQYYAMQFDDSRMNMQQPGIVVSLGGDMADVPIKFDMYGTLRTTGRNNSSPFVRQATNSSRLYRFAFEYDDKKIVIGAGRILPTYGSPSGYIDGVSVARHLGKITGGIAFGFQPDPSLQLPSTNIKKFVVFGQYQGTDNLNTTASAAYTHAWSIAGTEREALSAYLFMFSLNGFSLYASSDIDLKVRANGENKFSPALSLLVCSANYRFSEIVTAGISIDASRPVYSLVSNKTIPDSLLDKELRSGIAFNVNFSLWRGASIYNVFSNRLEQSQFGKYFTNTSTLFYSNIARTGINLRLNYLINQDHFINMHGFGINAQRNLFGVDVGVRFQQNRSNIFNMQISNTTTTIGTDVSVFLTNRLTLMGSFDLLHGLGSSSRSLYLETSLRL